MNVAFSWERPDVCLFCFGWVTWWIRTNRHYFLPLSLNVNSVLGVAGGMILALLEYCLFKCKKKNRTSAGFCGTFLVDLVFAAKCWEESTKEVPTMEIIFAYIFKPRGSRSSEYGLNITKPPAMPHDLFTFSCWIRVQVRYLYGSVGILVTWSGSYN